MSSTTIARARRHKSRAECTIAACNLSFEVPSAAAAYRDLRSRGVAFTGEPEKQFWGGTLATFKDPAGNELQICEQPRA